MPASPRKELSLFDSTCLIVGVIVGVGIYQTAPDIAAGTGVWWGVILIWIVGGLLSLCGALAYAELATAYPKTGGDVIYLTRAYGRWAGFLFGWMQLTVVRPGDIAVMAFAFATFARAVYDPLGAEHIDLTHRLYAANAILGLTVIHIIGVRQGKWTQNILTVIKVLCIIAIIGVAVCTRRGAAPMIATEAHGFPLTVALILVLFTYGGWNEMAYVAAEVKHPSRNILHALVIGTLAVTALYVLANAAFIHALGYDGLASSQSVATDIIRRVLPDSAGRAVGAMICISALGAVSGLIFTGARISSAVGEKHHLFKPLGAWHPRTRTPIRALAVQSAIALILVLALGSFLDAVMYTAAAVYLFYLATTGAVIILRIREPHIKRPYRMTLYPLPAVIFIAVCGFLIWGAVDYKPTVSAAAAGIIVAGLPAYWISRRISQSG